jgi:hypothetical protein
MLRPLIVQNKLETNELSTISAQLSALDGPFKSVPEAES